MATRLARLFNTTPESWLNMHQALDIWELEYRADRTYARIESVTAQIVLPLRAQQSDTGSALTHSRNIP